MSKPEVSALSRRNLLAGAGAVGAAAVAATALSRAVSTDAPVVAAAVTPPAQGGGYRVTPHVLHYYQTARV